MSDFDAFRDKMTTAGVREAAIRAFARSYESLLAGGNRLMPEADLKPVEQLPSQDSFTEVEFGKDLLDQAAIIKLNGGLGTSMGLQKAKSLLEVRDGRNFLDIIARQVIHLREATGARVRFLLMNSFSTTADTLDHMRRYADQDLAAADEIELMQNQVPKIDAETMGPVEWSADPQLEWCPPGHGDLYAALEGSGWLDRLLESGVRYAFVSNSDNLGAVLDPVLLAHFAESGSAFMMEVTKRTESDRKGGHLAVSAGDGRLVLREVAQCPEEDLESFQDITRHRYFNTNNLWLRLDVLKEVMEREGGVLPLPIICNKKTVDPRDKKSTPVIQLETAMGAGIEAFENAHAVEVGRGRFAPVKTTADLLALRSDAYELSDEGRVHLVAARGGVPPVVTLGEDYKMVDSLEGMGVPSLLNAKSLTVSGAVRFGERAVIEGAVSLVNEGRESLELDRLARDEEIRKA